MSLGLYDYDRRYRRRFWAGFIKFVLVVVLLVGAGLFTYQIGVEQFKERDASLRQEVTALEAERDRLRALATQLRQAQVNAEARVTELETRLSRELPQGPLADLVKLVAQRMAEGVSAERLTFVIAQAQERRNCSPPEVKRFVVATPISRNTANSVSFGNGAVSVAGAGKSATNASGAPEAWYDAGQPLEVTITTHGGKQTVTEGVLPIQRSVVIEDTEYRITIVAGSRAFAEVTFDRCAYP